jgi:ubiquinone/menaquinone biosynthesis C-methylase UbiE
MTSPMSTPVPWNLVAPAYAEEVVPLFETYAIEALRLAKPAAGARIIDVACGPGTLATLAAQKGHPVDALDFSPAMIERLESRVKALGLTNVTSHTGDGQALPFADGVFGAGFSMFGLMFFPDRAKGFSELRRVLAPGARAVISSWTPLESTPVMAAMFGALRETMGKVLGQEAPLTGNQEMPLTQEAACLSEMSAAFADVAVHRVPHTHRYASADALWESLVRTMAPIVLMKRKLGDQWSPLDEAARDAIRACVGEAPADVTMTAWLTVGTAR